MAKLVGQRPERQSVLGCVNVGWGHLPPRGYGRHSLLNRSDCVGIGDERDRVRRRGTRTASTFSSWSCDRHTEKWNRDSLVEVAMDDKGGKAMIRTNSATLPIYRGRHDIGLCEYGWRCTTDYVTKIN